MNFRRRTLLLALPFAGLPVPVPAAAEPGSTEPKDPTGIVIAGFDLLQKRYWSPELGLWLDKPGNDLRACYEGRLNPPWWSSANAVETMARFLRCTGRALWKEPLLEMHRRYRSNPDVAPELVAALKKAGDWPARDEKRRSTRPRPRHLIRKEYRDFTNEYLDDSGWWGLAWLEMHRWTGDASLLETARRIHRHMDAHRVADGGIVWNLEQNPQVTNAITNSLFLTLSNGLYAITKEAGYREKALAVHRWFGEQKLDDGTGIVDGPGHQADYWSYNQGMWIRGLLGLHRSTDDDAFLREAVDFTSRFLDRGGFLKDDVLIEKLSQTGWDTALFKGVLARALGELRDVLRSTRTGLEVADRLEKILQASQVSLLRHSRGPTGEFGLQWQAGAEKQEWNFNSHLAGLMLLSTSIPAGGK